MGKKFLSLMLLIFFSLSLSGCYFFPTEEEVLEPPVVKVEEVVYKTYVAQSKDIENALISTGYILSTSEVDLKFEEALYPLKTIYVKTGDFVKKGDLIAELDTDDLARQVVLQRLLVKKAQALYNESSTNSNLSQLNYERELLSQMESDLNSSRLYAPMDGQIASRIDLDPGEDVRPFITIVKIVDSQNMYIKHTSNALKDFTLNMDVTITVGNTAYEGYVSQTPKEADGTNADDENSIYFKFKNDLPNFKRVGSTATVKAVLEVHKNAVVVPRHHVKYLDGRVYMQIVKDGKKVDIDVETGISNATEIEIISGLSAGDLIVVN